MELSIIIVNWNTGELLRNCVASILKFMDGSAPRHEIIVVDNASTDDSLSGIDPSANVTVLANSVNRGFGAACNQGARAAGGRCLLFLNPDCELRLGTLPRCLEELGQPDVGVCGVALADETGLVARSCHRFPTLRSFVYRIVGLHRLSARYGDGAMTEWDHANDADVDHVIGAFYAVPRELFLKLGGFDERFFVYLEDLDLSYRVRAAGYRVRFLAQPPSFHLGGGASRNIKARRLFYATRSRVLYAFKHFPRWQGHLHLAMTLLIEPGSRSIFAAAQGSVAGLHETWSGFAMLYSDLPNILATARHP